MKKKLIALFMLVIMAISTSVPAYAANTITYIHGNESNRCYAETTQSVHFSWVVLIRFLCVINIF